MPGTDLSIRRGPGRPGIHRLQRHHGTGARTKAGTARRRRAAASRAATPRPEGPHPHPADRRHPVHASAADNSAWYLGRNNQRRTDRHTPGRPWAPAPSPSPASWTGWPSSTKLCTASRPAGGRCGCCTSRPGRTPAAPRRRPAAPLPGTPARPSPPRRSGSPRGKRRPHAARSRRCPACTSRSRSSPPASAPCAHAPRWVTRPSAGPRGSRWPRCKSSTRRAGAHPPRADDDDRRRVGR
jgi:hypothetical protein